jgi:hypothetical protein
MRLIVRLPKAKGLEQITAEKTAQGMQVSSNNPMVGLEGRASLLVNLSHALKSNPTFFGAEGRPGNLIGKDMCFFFSVSRSRVVYPRLARLTELATLLQISSNRSPSRTDQVVAFLLQPSGMSSSQAWRRSGLQIVLRSVVSRWAMSGHARH